jgi:hypothetical protein
MAGIMNDGREGKQGCYQNDAGKDNVESEHGRLLLMLMGIFEQAAAVEEDHQQGDDTDDGGARPELIAGELAED